MELTTRILFKINSNVMKKIEAFITKLYTKVFGEPTTVKYLSGKSSQIKETNNENR
jgi:hypothetical protein